MVLLSEVASSISLAIGPGFLVSLAVITYFVGRKYLEQNNSCQDPNMNRL